MSAWLSEANRIAGAVRGQAVAEARRQTTAALNRATRDNLERWFGAMGMALPKTRRRRVRDGS